MSHKRQNNMNNHINNQTAGVTHWRKSSKSTQIERNQASTQNTSTTHDVPLTHTKTRPETNKQTKTQARSHQPVRPHRTYPHVNVKSSLLALGISVTAAKIQSPFFRLLCHHLQRHPPLSPTPITRGPVHPPRNSVEHDHADVSDVRAQQEIFARP